MAAATTTSIVRRARGLHPRRDPLQQNPEGKGSTLPEYLEASEVQAILAAAMTPRARVSMLLQWRAGLRVSEIMAQETSSRLEISMKG